MLRLRHLSQKYQKRLIRPLYGQTQAYPYASVLDASFRNADGSIRMPLASDTTPVTRSADAFTLQNGLVPGLVMIKSVGESACVATGANVAEQPFGLLANNVGGDIDELADENEIGVWRGPDAVFELLQPAFNPAGLQAAYQGAVAGNPVKLFAGADGRLTVTAPVGTPSNAIVVAHLVEAIGTSRIVIDFKV